MSEACEITILMSCLDDEAETLASSISRQLIVLGLRIIYSTFSSTFSRSGLSSRLKRDRSAQAA